MDIFTNNALLPTDIKKKNQLAKIAASKRHSVLYVQPVSPQQTYTSPNILKGEKGQAQFQF